VKKVAVASVGMLILITLAALGWFAVSRDPATAEPATANGPVTRPAGAAPGPSPAGGSAVAPILAAQSGVAELPVTNEADAYAAAVATSVFGMDTRVHDPQAYRELLLGQADPHLSVTGFADLQRLLAERIPTADQWARMRENAQWSTFEPSEVWEPGSWTQVVIAGDAEPGWVVRNVTGVQTTHYTEHGVAKSAVRERSVTIAMRCPATGAGVDSCRLVLIGGSVLP